MSIKKIVAKQYRDKVNRAVSQFGSLSMLPNYGLPQEGWLRTVRTALGMSGTQLAKKLGVTKARISKVEQDEPHGSVTLKTMQTMAEAMDCKFIYAIVPKQNIENVIKERAIEKARAQVKSASTHMALEAQALNKEQLEYEIERIASQIVDKLPSDFWNDE
ncbi:DNA-binding protein [Paraglaciecola hydrolytica]|uniref:DNA-binding protein n=1 Tax=Paraglaciecola hydrolytica TaxID=1799789 RepID=A0A148KLS7_9ALTE|nr:DNA-binding protein [Paraglaciecola hydrolytica]